MFGRGWVAFVKTNLCHLAVLIVVMNGLVGQVWQFKLHTAFHRQPMHCGKDRYDVRPPRDTSTTQNKKQDSL